MNLAGIRAELEDELRWRSEELRFFKNQLGDLRGDVERKRFRRALVVMLYSHFEGFWKAAFSIYVKALNAEAILCKDAVDSLVAATHFDLLASLASQKKATFLNWTPPDDPTLHMFHRQVEFLARLPDFRVTKLDIPDEVVNPESNLKPDVIRKNLFRLGFPHNLFQSHEGTVHKLLNKRNSVAHGATRLGVEEDEFNDLEQAVMEIMEDIVKLLFNWLHTRKYLKSA